METKAEKSWKKRILLPAFAFLLPIIIAVVGLLVFDFKDTGTQRVRVERSELRIQVDKDITVFLDGKQVNPNRYMSIPVLPGKYFVEFYRKKKKVFQQKLEVKPGTLRVLSIPQ